MPLASIHLFSLRDPSTLPNLLQDILSSPIKPLTISKPIRWVIRPSHIDATPLLQPTWHLLLILESTPPSQNLISSLLSKYSLAAHWSTQAGIPSRLTKNFTTTTNPALLHPDPSTIPSLTGALNDPLLSQSSQDLTLSTSLQQWIGTSPSTLPITGPVSMLNLLSFNPDLKDSYLKYGKAFADSIGSKRGGNAKLVGNIVHADTKERSGRPDGGQRERWDEFALAQYPSLLHFADMLASRDYQEVNQKYRVPSLADTCILCTSEIEIEKMVEELGPKAKL